MNLFRSEEHIRNWASFVQDTDEGITPLPDMVKLFSGPYFRRRLDPDYVSHMMEYAREMIGTMKEIGKTGPFWKRPPDPLAGGTPAGSRGAKRTRRGGPACPPRKV